MGLSHFCKNKPLHAVESSLASKGYPEEAKLLLSALFIDFADYYIEIRLLDKGRPPIQLFYPSIATIRWDLIREKNSEGYNCYFGLFGYEIARTLEAETRTCPYIDIEVIDIGLTVKEALDMGLESERVLIQKRPSWELLDRLAPEEKQFLLGERSYLYGHSRAYQGRRVELNAMTTDQLVSWLEGKLKELGLQTKVLPPEDVVNQELEDTIESQLDDDIGKMVKEAIERLLGATIADIEDEVKEEIGMPGGDGYYEELKRFLQDCPPEYWRDWITKKATELEEGHIEDKESMVLNLLTERLRRQP